MKGHILIVDDDQGIRDGLRRLLKGDGYAVQEAEDGAQGLNLLAVPGLDLVMLDLDMPGMNGLEVCEAFKKLPHGPDTPVLFLTGSHDNAAYDKAIAAGADDFLSKPVRWPELRMRVHALVRLGRSIRAQKAGMEALLAQQHQLEADEHLRTRMKSFLVEELQAPLSQIRHEAELMLDSASGTSGWEAVYDRAEHLLHRVASWSDFLSVREGKLQARLESVDPASYLRIQIERHRLWADVRRIRLSLVLPPSLPRVRVDRPFLDRALTHLFDLLMRAIPNGAALELRADHAPGDRVIIGMHALGRAKPSSGATEEGEPTGLGLEWAFCRTALTAMGGSVAAESGPESYGYRLDLPVDSLAQPLL